MKLEKVKQALMITLMLGPETGPFEIGGALNDVDPDNEWNVAADDLFSSGYLVSTETECAITAKGKRLLR